MLVELTLNIASGGSRNSDLWPVLYGAPFIWISYVLSYMVGLPTSVVFKYIHYYLFYYWVLHHNFTSCLNGSVNAYTTLTIALLIAALNITFAWLRIRFVTYTTII